MLGAWWVEEGCRGVGLSVCLACGADEQGEEWQTINDYFEKVVRKCHYSLILVDKVKVFFIFTNMFITFVRFSN